MMGGGTRKLVLILSAVLLISLVSGLAEEEAEHHASGWEKLREKVWPEDEQHGSREVAERHRSGWEKVRSNFWPHHHHHRERRHFEEERVGRLGVEEVWQQGRRHRSGWEKVRSMFWPQHHRHREPRHFEEERVGRLGVEDVSQHGRREEAEGHRSGWEKVSSIVWPHHHRHQGRRHFEEKRVARVGVENEQLPPWIPEPSEVYWSFEEKHGPKWRKEEEKKGGVVSTLWSYLSEWMRPLGFGLPNPAAGQDKEKLRAVEEEEGTVHSFFRGIRSSLRRWKRSKRLAAAGRFATEPLVLENDMSSGRVFAAKLIGIVGKVLEDYYASPVAREEATSCVGVLEEQAKKIVRSLKTALKEQLCVDDATSLPEQKFCNLFESHPKLATLMVFAKADVNPVTVALMRTATTGFCVSADDNGELQGSVHQVEMLARHLPLQMLRLSLVRPGDGDRMPVEHHEHEHEDDGHQTHLEHDHERHWWHRDHKEPQPRMQADTVDENSCKECVRTGIHRLSKAIKLHVATTCQSTTCPKIIAACKFAKEHRFLVKTYLILKIRLWEIVAVHCAGTCRSSPGPMFQLGDYHHRHAPNLGRHAMDRGLVDGDTVDIADLEADVRQHFRLGTEVPQFLVSHHMPHFGHFVSGGCTRQNAGQQAYRRALQLKGHNDHILPEGYGGFSRTRVVMTMGPRRTRGTHGPMFREVFGNEEMHNMFSDMHDKLKQFMGKAESTTQGVEPDVKTDSVVLRPFRQGRPLKRLPHFRISANPRVIAAAEDTHIVTADADNKDSSKNNSDEINVIDLEMHDNSGSDSADGGRAEM